MKPTSMLESNATLRVLVTMAMLGASACDTEREPAESAKSLAKAAPKSEGKAAPVAEPAPGAVPKPEAGPELAAMPRATAAPEDPPAPDTETPKLPGEAEPAPEDEPPPKVVPKISVTTSAVTLATIEPATVLGIPGPWTLDKEEEDFYDREGGDGVYFVQRPFSKEGKEHVLVLWGDYEGDEMHGALLEGTRGAWTVKWNTMVIEDAGTLYNSRALKMPVLDLGGHRIGVLFRPQEQGCGAAPCTPEDDFITTTLFEITGLGLKPVWSLENGPWCAMPDEDTGHLPTSHTCRVALVPSVVSRHFDLEVTVKLGTRKKAKKTTYGLIGGAYKPL